MNGTIMVRFGLWNMQCMVLRLTFIVELKCD